MIGVALLVVSLAAACSSNSSSGSRAARRPPLAARVRRPPLHRRPDRPPDSADPQPAALPASSQAAGSGTASVIEYWLWDANQLPAYQACADAFHTTNPNVTVKITQYGWDDYWTKINNGFTSGTGTPDVFTDHLSKYPEFVQQAADPADRDASRRTADTDIYQAGPALAVDGAGRQALRAAEGLRHRRLFYNKDMVKAAGYTAA